MRNIFRHIERDGSPPTEAAVTGTDEIMAAVVSSTLTIMIVFLPMLLVEGRSGQMFFQFALVVVFSLSISLLDATTVVPMLASRMASADGNPHVPWLLHRFESWSRLQEGWEETYRRALVWALDHKAATLVMASGITLSSFALVPFVGTELMPATDSGDFTVTIRLPVGTALDVTEKTMLRVEQMLLDAIGTNMGLRGAGTSSTSFLGSATVKLKEDRKRSTLENIADLRRQVSALPGVRAQIQPFDMVSRVITGRSQDMELYLFGQDLEVLWTQAARVIDHIAGIPGLTNLDTNWQEANPEIQFTVDREKLMQVGLGFEEVADTLGTATKGSVVSYFQDGGYQYPIQVQFPQELRRTLPRLLELPVHVPGGGGRYLTLGQVVTARSDLAPNQITRLNRQRYIAITGGAEGRPAGDIRLDVDRALEELDLPEGYYLDWGASVKQQAEEFEGMTVAVLLAVALIYMLLASQFESLIHPLTVLTSVPLAASGVILALFLSGRSFGLTAFVGLLLLVGIVVKNGILLVDYTNQLRHRGLPRREALLRAGPTRMRPILMTAGASVLGMLPLAVGMARGSEIQAPMATAIVGGLMASTLLTLLVVPVVYTLLDEVPARLRRLFRRS